MVFFGGLNFRKLFVKKDTIKGITKSISLYSILGAPNHAYLINKPSIQLIVHLQFHSHCFCIEIRNAQGLPSYDRSVHML
jgi:hypothetical protein